MTDDRAALLETNLKQVETFKAGVAALQPGPHQLNELIRSWDTNQKNLLGQVLPRVEPAVQLAARSMIQFVADALKAASATDTLPNNMGAHLRNAWKPLIDGQLAALLKLLKEPPTAALAPPPTNAPPTARDLEKAKKTLDEGALPANEARTWNLRVAGYVTLAVGVAAILAAALLPFLFHPGHGTTGWALAVMWSARLLAVATLVVGAVQAFSICREMMSRAAEEGRAQAMLKILAASAYFGEGSNQAAAMIQLVDSLSQQPASEDGSEQPVVLPSALIKELPGIVKTLASRK